MSKPDPSRVQELFLAALDLPAEQRDAWLIEQCGNDPQLLHEVRSLLVHDSPADDPLEHGLDEALLSDAGLLKQPEQGLHVRCPHCRNPIELIDDHALDSVTCSSCGSSFSLIAAEETQPHVPSKDERIAHFNIVDKVGAGAFGTVYRAFDESLSRTVAIKMPRKGQLTAAETEKFFREARTAAQLRHPNIVSVHEVGRDDDRIYIVSDFVDGLTLTDWLTGMQPTPRETASLLIKVARALHHAHEQGVIHRDLKPGNIMLDRDNEPHLMDFGLAKREAGEITMTLDGQVLGTPAYMSPEQARGEGHHVDRRADVYALGVILFQMLTGDRPFRGNTRMLLHQVLTEEAPSPRKLNASVPRDLETICLKCLEKSPDRRYDTADHFADELQRYLDHQPISARPIGRVERGWRWCKRNPVVAGLSVLLALALLLGTIVSASFAVDANDKANRLVTALEDVDDQRQIALNKAAEADTQRDIAAEKASEAEAERQKVQTAYESLQKQEYVREILIADAELNNHEIDRATVRLEQIPVERRGWEWGHLACRCLPAAVELKVSGKDAEHIHSIYALSRDGALLAYEPEGYAGIVLIDTKTLKELRRIPLDDGGRTVGPIAGFSADGKFLVTGGWEKPVRIWDLSKGRLHRAIHDGRITRSVRVANQEKWISVCIGNRVEIWDFLSGKQVSSAEKRFGWYSVFFPDDSRAVLGTGGGNNRIIDVNTGDHLGNIRHGDGPAWPAVFDSTGTTVVLSSTGSKAAMIWDVNSSHPRYTLNHDAHPTSACFDEHNGLIYTADRTGRVRVWSQEDQSLLHHFEGHSEAVLQMSLMKNGQWLVTGGRDLVIRFWPCTWLVSSASVPFGNQWCVSFSPTGNHFALFTDTGRFGVAFHDATAPPLMTAACSKKGGYPGSNYRQFLSWNVSGNQLVANHQSGGAFVLDSSTGEPLCPLASPTPLESVLFAQDDATIVGGERGKILFFDGVSGKLTGELTGFRGAVHSMCRVGSTGVIAVAGMQDRAISLVDMKNRKTIRTIDVGFGRIVDIGCDANANRMVVATHDGACAIVLDIDSGEVVFRTEAREDTHHQVIYAASISPDGSRLALVSAKPSVELYHIDQQAKILSLHGDTNEFRDVSWSPDGTTLIAAGEGQGYLGAWQSGDWTKSIEELRLEKLKDYDYWDPFRPTRTVRWDDQEKRRELYALHQQWARAADADAQLSGGRVTWERSTLLFASGRDDEYRDVRAALLKDYEQLDQPWQHHQYLQQALLGPLDDSLAPAVRWLAEKNATAEEPWRRELVGQAMYRLGEYRQWHDSLPDDSPLRQGQNLLLAIVALQEDLSDENRKRLQSELERAENRLQNQLKDGVIQGNWNGYVKQSAWVAEARKALNTGSEAPVTPPDSDDPAVLKGEAERLIADGQLKQAIERVERAGALSQEPDHALLRDLYARTLQWDKALAASRQLPHGPESWEQFLLLYMAGEYEEYREARPHLLARTDEYQASWQYQLYLIGALLLPLDETDHEAVRVLAERNANGPESWNRGMVGKAMYGLGEFREWYDSLPDDSELKKGHELRLRMTEFRDNPGKKNQYDLEEAIQREQDRTNRMVKNGVLGRYWQNYVERFAWLAQARNVLKSASETSD